MKRIGLIGGLGPEATVDYYKEIIHSFEAIKKEEMVYPEILIYSVNMSEFLDLMKKQEYNQAVLFLLNKVDALVSAGADFVAITANTPHLLFDRLKEKIGIPLISIVEATCKEALAQGLKRPGLIGTGFTMNASFYPDVFKRYGMEILVPGITDKELINHKLFSEIELGIFKEETREMLIGIIEKMVNEQHIDSIILGCTEFPLILRDPEYADIPVLNTTKIHVKEIVDFCLNN
jgi:aspartate racemase